MFILRASQQAIWQNVNLTQSQILGGQASQPAAVGQPTSHLKNVNLTLIQILRRCPSFTSIHKWHFVRWPTNQPAAIGQPTSHLTKYQPDPKSDLGGIWLCWLKQRGWIWKETTLLICCYVPQQLLWLHVSAVCEQLHLLFKCTSLLFNFKRYSSYTIFFIYWNT